MTDGSAAGLPAAKAKLATKEKAAANVQITAEQLLRESAALQRSDVKPGPKRLVDEDELEEHRVRKRKEYEDQIRRRRYAIPIWLSYATWEAEQSDFRRARSIFERALEIDHEHSQLWNRYLDMEIQNHFVNHARNLFDRVVALMPRVDHFWLKYVAFEEALQMYSRVREIFERWMEWNPDDRAWLAYAKFEERCGEIDRAREILERFLVAHPTQSSFIRVAQWEVEQRDNFRARGIYETALDVLKPPELTQKLFLKFADFEETCRRDYEQAKAVFLEGLRRLGTGEQTANLERAYLSFQKRRGDAKEIDEATLGRRRRMYEAMIESSGGYDYDLWLSLIRLLEEQGDMGETRAAYERAVTFVPVESQKSKWRRYFYIWLLFATFEELTAKDLDRAAGVYERLRNVIPHESFSFAKFWKLWASFEVRRGNLDKARLIFGEGLGRYPVEKVFRAYCDMELQLGNIDRARNICSKFIATSPNNATSWLALIDVELLAKEVDRAREVFERAVARSELVNQEILWKSFIDVEANLGNYDRCRQLFERLFSTTNHWKALKGLADFCEKTVNDIEGARNTYKRVIAHCKVHGLDAERAKLLEDWLTMEKSIGDEARIAAVTKQLPRKVRKRRTVVSDDGTSSSIQEYTAFVFPEEETVSSSVAILEAAKRWKQRKVG